MKAPLRLTTLATMPSTQVLQTMTGMLTNQPSPCEAKYPLSEFLSSDVSHNFLLRSLQEPDGYIGHWGLQEAQRDSFTMCNYRTDKLNAQQSKAFPDPWLPDFDKEQGAFFGQFTVFKIEIPVLMNTLTVARMVDFCLSLMRAELCRYTVKHASLIQLWNHRRELKSLCKALKAVQFVLGLVTCQPMLKGIVS